jgi:hypothetical protein
VAALWGPALTPEALAVLEAARVVLAAHDPGPLTAALDEDGVVWLFTADGAPHSMMSLEAYVDLRRRAEKRRGTGPP